MKLGFELKDTLGDRNHKLERNKIENGCQNTIPKAVADELLTSLIQKKNCKVILKEGNREELIRLQNEYKLDIILTNSVPAVDNSFIYETRLLKKESLEILGALIELTYSTTRSYLCMYRFIIEIWIILRFENKCNVTSLFTWMRLIVR